MNINNHETMINGQEKILSPEERVAAIQSELSNDELNYVAGFDMIKGDNPEFDALIERMIKDAEEAREDAFNKLANVQ